MAVTATSIATDLVLVMDNGVSTSGLPLSKNRTYKSIKTDATDDAVYAVAQALIDIQSKINNFMEDQSSPIYAPKFFKEWMEEQYLTDKSARVEPLTIK